MGSSISRGSLLAAIRSEHIMKERKGRILIPFMMKMRLLGIIKISDGIWHGLICGRSIMIGQASEIFCLCSRSHI